MDQKKETLIFVATCADEQPDRATIPFVLANAALAMDTDAIIVLQMTGVYLALKNYAQHVHAAGFAPLQELMDAFQEEGGRLWICGPCIQSRQISPDDLIEGADVISGVALIEAMTSAKNVMVY